MSESLRIAVTGGSGRVGKFVVRHLLDRGHRVVNLDRRSEADERARFVQCDVRSYEEVSAALRDCDAVCHLADIPNVKTGPSIDEVYWSNARTSGVVLQAAADLQLRRVVYTSTCQIYGYAGEGRVPPKYLPVDEAHPSYPSNAYAISKTAAEMFAQMTSRCANLPVTIFRLPYVMEREPDRQALEGIEHDDSPVDNGLRTFVHGDDCGAAYVAALDSALGGCEVFNICADDVMSIKPITDQLARHPGFPKLPAGWPALKSPVSSEKAKANLGWKPKWRFADFFRRTMGREPLAG
jgi:nucleoside-diphosphate-sugar epimerase